MHDGRRREHWIHTAALEALIANCHRNPKTKKTPFRHYDFLPEDLAGEVKRVAKPIFTRGKLRAMKSLFKPPEKTE